MPKTQQRLVSLHKSLINGRIGLTELKPQIQQECASLICFLQLSILICNPADCGLRLSATKCLTKLDHRTQCFVALASNVPRVLPIGGRYAAPRWGYLVHLKATNQVLLAVSFESMTAFQAAVQHPIMAYLSQCRFTSPTDYQHLTVAAVGSSLSVNGKSSFG